jgi:hypothetical protein
MDAYDRYTNLGEKILPTLLQTMVEAKNVSDHLLIKIVAVATVYLHLGDNCID